MDETACVGTSTGRHKLITARDGPNFELELEKPSTHLVVAL